MNAKQAKKLRIVVLNDFKVSRLSEGLMYNTQGKTIKVQAGCAKHGYNLLKLAYKTDAPFRKSLHEISLKKGKVKLKGAA